MNTLDVASRGYLSRESLGIASRGFITTGSIIVSNLSHGVKVLVKMPLRYRPTFPRFPKRL